MGEQKKYISRELIPLIMMVVMAVVSVWPVIRKPASIVNIGKDGYLINWIIHRSGNNIYRFFSSDSVRELYESGKNLFEGNIFYPNRQVLAYSDMYFLTGFWTVFWGILLGSPGIVSGLGLVGGQIFTMGLVYWWWKQMTDDRWAAMAAATLLGWSVIRWHYQVHLQMWNMQWWLLAAFLFWKWKQNNRLRYLIFSGAAWGLVFWESLLPAYFTILVIGLISWPEIRKIWNKIVIFIVTGLIIAAPVLLVYREVSRENGTTRSVREAAHNGLAIDEFGGRFFDPVLYVVLAVSGGFLGLKKVDNKNLKWLTATLIVSLLLSLGPVLKWQNRTVKLAGLLPIPLPYSIVYYTVPGFDAFRTPSRWIWVAGWAGSGIVAIALSRVRPDKKAFAVGVVMCLVIAGGGKLGPIKELEKYANFPEVYQWLSQQPGKVVLELPMGDENIEAERMYYSLGHKKKLVNGYSGFYPQDNIRWKKLTGENASEAEVWQAIKAGGVEYIIVHKELYDSFEAEKWKGLGEGQKVWENEQTLVFKL